MTYLFYTSSQPEWRPILMGRNAEQGTSIKSAAYGRTYLLGPRSAVGCASLVGDDGIIYRGQHA